MGIVGLTKKNYFKEEGSKVFNNVFANKMKFKRVSDISVKDDEEEIFGNLRISEPSMTHEDGLYEIHSGCNKPFYFCNCKI